MKLSLFRYIYISLFLFGLFCSCKEKPTSDHILAQAQSLIENNPSKSLDLLNSITDPQSMKRDKYMQYVVSSAYAKHQANLGVVNDTLVSEAKQYFNLKNDPKQAALANFSAGWFFYENDNLGKSIDSFMQAEIDASKAGNDKLAGRSANNVGYLYYDQAILDSAIIYYRKAIGYYQKANIKDSLMLKVFINIGQAYIEEDKQYIAYDYLQRGLKLATDIGNKDYEMKFKSNIGVIFLKNGDYAQAKLYLFDALSQVMTSTDRSKIYLNLARTYNVERQTTSLEESTILSDSSQYYSNLVKSSISETSDKYMLESIYGALSAYYKYVPDFEQALYYSDLKTNIIQRIDSENQAQKLHESTMRIHLERKEVEIQKTELRNDFYIVGGIFIFFLLMLTSILIVRAMRKSYMDTLNDVELLKTKYHHRIENMLLLQNTYFNTMMNLVDNNKNDNQQQSNKDSKTEYTHTKQMILSMKKRTHDQLADWAKDSLLKNASIQKILDKLDDEDILFLALCGCKYTESEIIAILDIDQEMLYLRKLELRNLFELNGFSETEIDKHLFIENNRIHKYE